MPETGTATFAGRAIGGYMAEYGTDKPGVLDGTTRTALPGSRYTGEFGADTSLRMDYARGTVEGTVSNLKMIGVFTGGPSQGVRGETFALEGDFRSRDRAFGDIQTGPQQGRHGRRRNQGRRRRRRNSDRQNRRIEPVAADRGVERRMGRSSWLRSHGARGGRGGCSSVCFVYEQSNVVGVFGVEATTAGDTRHVFIGAFGAYREDFLRKHQ